MNSQTPVDLGLPRDVEWRDRVLHGCRKKPVPGRVVALLYLARHSRNKLETGASYFALKCGTDDEVWIPLLAAEANESGKGCRSGLGITTQLWSHYSRSPAFV
jgi:hypothetical protein